MTVQDTQKNILVYAGWQEFDVPEFIGVLTANKIRGKEVFSFEYNKDWLKSPHNQYLDPELGLFPGKQYPEAARSNFGVFLDSSPDRWGRVLMQRREAALARVEKRAVRKLTESDYLLGVFDDFRLGALRFKLENDGPFLNDDVGLSVPPWSSLRKLEQLSLKIERDEDASNPEYLKWINMLIAPGSSLGGARPKAGVTDQTGQLWIAKFPSHTDTKDIGAWEMVAHTIAGQAGITLPEAQCRVFSCKRHTFLSKRFDRQITTRIHFASAMTMLGYNDGANAQQGAGYLEIAEFIAAYGANAEADLKELFRRILLNILISNTDDHLRNHGFLLKPRGWVLSPAYDINPNEFGEGLSLNISETDNALAPEIAIDVADAFRLKKTEAESILKEVAFAVKNWRQYASHYNISKSEQDLVSPAFKVK